MRALTLILGAILVTLSITKVSAAPMCREPRRSLASEDGQVFSCLISRDGQTSYGQSAVSKLKAKEIAREACGDKMIDQYIALRGSIPDDVIGDISTACINEECQ